MIFGLVMFAAVLIALGVLLNKFMDNTVGDGLGKNNREKWGMDEKEKYKD